MIETPRLLLRRMTVDDAPFVLRLVNDPAFLRFIGDKGVRTADDARRYILEGPIASYAAHGFGLYVTALKQDGVPIGMCGLLKREALEDVDVGFAFLPEHRSRGYAVEAARAVLHHGRVALGLTRIVAVVTPGNEASIRVLRRLGLEYEKTMRLSDDGDEVQLFVPVGEESREVE